MRKGSWLAVGALECGLHLLTPSGFSRFGAMAPSPQSLCWHHPRAHSWGSNSQPGWGASPTTLIPSDRLFEESGQCVAQVSLMRTRTRDLSTVGSRSAAELTSHTSQPVLLIPKAHRTGGGRGEGSSSSPGPGRLRSPCGAWEKRRGPDQGQEGAHLLDEVPGIRGEVGRQLQLPSDDLVHGFLPVLCSEGWLEKAEGERSLAGLPLGPPLPREGALLPPPCPPSRGGWTCRSSEHVVHQGPQAPPVHRPIVATAHQNLRGPGGQVEPSVRPSPAWLSARPLGPAGCRLHVLNGAAEGVGDGTLVNRLLAEAEVRQFDVT